MAVDQATRFINTGTAGVGTKIPVQVGFAPKAIFAFFTGRTGGGNSVAQGDTHKGVGLGVSPISRVCAGAVDLDSVGTTVCKSALRDDSLVNVINGAGSNGRLDIDSIGATSFDLIVDEAFSASYRILLWILGGTTITGTKIVQYTSPVAIGNQAVTGFGFSPDIYFLLNISDDGVFPQFRPGSKINFSAGISVTEQGCSYSASEDAKATSKTRHYATDIEDHASAKPNTSPEEIAKHVSMDLDGFTQDWTKVRNRALDVFALAIEGGDWAIKPILTETDIVTPIVVAGLASSPSGGIIVSACDVENVSGVEASPARISYGVWTIPGVSQGAHAEFSGDGLSTTAVTQAVRDDSCYVRVLTTNLTQGRMNVTSRDALGASFIMSEADAAAHFAWGVFAGPFATAFPPIIPPATGGSITMAEGVLAPLTKVVG